jgi:NADPH-dependent glutamate synthase beta subunit-like oxidoreductase
MHDDGDPALGARRSERQPGCGSGRLTTDRVRYSVDVPDPEYWKRQIKCQAACPVHTDARGYVRAVASGDERDGYVIARSPNPLASICGRICGAPCEANCRRGEIDKPIAIRALKRYLTERHGTETYRGDARDFFQSLLKRSENLECAGAEGLLAFRELIETRPLAGRTVSIVGSGPAGLAAAHDLALMGAEVTVIEMEDEPGGMLALGVPSYRLAREIIRAEVAVIRALGVRMLTGRQLGRDVSLSELRVASDAVIVAVGAKRSRKLALPGSDTAAVLGGVEFLRDVALGGTVALGQKVVVIGGGNVAYDVARTVVRQTESDVSRVALRQPFVKEVHLCCLESLEEMPADDVEILEGDEEGIYRHNSLGPKEIHSRAGKISGVVFKKCLSVFDAEGRFAPVFDEDDLLSLEADTVIMSVGQTPDLSFLEDAPDVRLTERGLIEVDDSQMTTAPGLFLAGDLAHGTKLLIDAEASGKRVARAIFRYLTARTLRLGSENRHVVLDAWRREKDYEKMPRTPLPTAPSELRVQSVTTSVELGYDDAAAAREALRCLDCGVNTIFDGEKCILCGGCADVCPEMCLKLVSATSLKGPDVAAALEAQLSDHPPEDASAIIKDEDRCIRCALCAERCPTGAITMERFGFKEEWHVAETV